MAALARARNRTKASGDQPALLVEDHLEPRVRIPADLLRCVIATVEIALLAGVAVLASATATGVEVDFVGASHRLPHAVLNLIGIAGNLALPVLPVVLAIRLGLARQFRRLAEAIGTGTIAVGVVALANLLLNLPALRHMHSALHTASAAASHEAALDGYLAGLVAYVTVIGLRGHAHLRPAFLTGIGLYGLATLADRTATVLSLLITVLIGSAIGSGLRYALGTISGRPTASDIASALTTPEHRIVAIRRVGDGSTEVRRYAATLASGKTLDVTVFDRDQQAADAFYRLYRRIRVRASISRSAPLTLEGAVERQALLIYATEDAGIRTPRLHAVTRVGPDAAALATDHVEGSTLAQSGSATTDDQLRHVWDTVLQLHKHRVTHRALTADRIMFAARTDGRRGGDGVVLLDPGNGDVAASDLQSRMDLAQLLAQTALVVGADRAADIAIEKVAKEELPGLVPLLQPVALFRSTRSELRGRKSLLTAVRKRLIDAAPDGEVQPVQLERIRPRAVITLIAGVFAAYLLAGQLADVSFKQLLERANLGWAFVALALSACTYLGATWAISGFTLERLNPVYTFLVQVAGSFVILVTPAAVGGVALNVRYLRRAKLSAANAAASVGVMQVISLLIYVLLVLISVAITGQSHAANALKPHRWEYIALGVVTGIVLIVLAFPAWRKQVFSRAGSIAGQVIPRLLDVAQRRVKLAEGIGGALLISVAYILCLAASVRAMGMNTVPLASIAVVYLTGNAVGSIVPIPGGIGAIETAMSLGLTAAGLKGGTAIAAVLLFRTVTFWLPAPAGWAAFNYLQRKEAL
ncbi:MAG TPA: lysylphosphatidylglycerol synthase domain-containing protein [Streptosporangiaceae bacterium]|nr:lysylphosphatidylglycerol synthase domain-containing protein [Streptosporangiaceae bacterium]